MVIGPQFWMYAGNHTWVQGISRASFKQCCSLSKSKPISNHFTGHQTFRCSVIYFAVWIVNKLWAMILHQERIWFRQSRAHLKQGKEACHQHRSCLWSLWDMLDDCWFSATEKMNVCGVVEVIGCKGLWFGVRRNWRSPSPCQFEI